MGIRESGFGRRGKSAHLQEFRPASLGQQCPTHCPPPNAPELARSAILKAPLALGPPLNIGEVAALIGCSPWTVRQKLIPNGLPVFRSGASGKLIFYEAQVVRWIENQQQKQKGGRGR